MLRVNLFIFFHFLSFLSVSQIMWQLKKDTVVKWYYYDGDEFNGSSVDVEKWTPAYSWTQLNYQFEYLMTPERLVFENGVCKFTCYQDTGLYEVPAWQFDSAFKKQYKNNLVERNKFRYIYSAGNVWSKRQYSKGYFEIRFKTTDSYGMWPAFWLYGNNKDEIDFFELKGEKNNQVHIDVHCLNGCDHGYRGGSLFPKSFGGWIKTTEGLTQGYNVLAGEWQDGYVKWYLNGVGIGIFKGDFGSEKMSLIIGTGPAKNGLGFSPGINETSTFPNSLDVDYVRVWYKSHDDKSEVLGRKHTEFNYFKEENKTPALLKKKIGYMYSKREFKNDFLTLSLLPSGSMKYVLTSLGKEIDFTIYFYEVSGEELFHKNITSSFEEINLAGLTKNLFIKMKIEIADKSIEEIIRLE